MAYLCCKDSDYMFIVLEGLDGAGKSTQIQYMQAFFEKRGRQVHFIHFPRFDAPVYGPLIAGFLRGDFGNIQEVHPQLVALLYAGDRREAASLIQGWLDRGHVVIADRYVYSNIAYQCAKLDASEQKEALRNWILQTEFQDFGIPRPQLNLFLDVPLSFVAAKLAAPRTGDDRRYLEGKADIHEADLRFQETVRAEYLVQAQKDPAFHIIPCGDARGQMLLPEQIFETIISRSLISIV